MARKSSKIRMKGKTCIELLTPGVLPKISEPLPPVPATVSAGCDVQQTMQFKQTSPGGTGVDRATIRNQNVVLEVLWHRKAQEERKAKDELRSEAIELQNWRNPRPAEAASPTNISESKVD
ncbi:hypothetical protein D5086_002575 [Populus alba]|uniref:Uncharacterized protein n=1 Tax=Populus alba TaxID=43335 RepID=A0ACC4D231_POPAL